MTLREQLKELADGSAQRHPGKSQDIMRSAIAQLESTDILAHALKTGDYIPKIQLSNATGTIILLNDILKEHKVVLTFYRGTWCPYCNLELRALQHMLPQIEAKGAKLVAISPQTPDNTLSTTQKNELTFEVLSDIGGVVAHEMNLIYKIPTALVDLYKTFNIDLTKSNGNLENELPIAATYVVEQSGQISYHFLAEDYKLRADPEDIIKSL